MKRFTHTLNALCLPLIAAIAFATVVVAESESFAESVRAPHAPANEIGTTHNGHLEAPGILRAGDLSR